MVHATYEHTDTFGGEVNYSWVHRGVVSLPDDATNRQVVMAVKKKLGLTGVRCDSEDLGDVINLRLRHCCQIVCITFGYGGETDA